MELDEKHQNEMSSDPEADVDTWAEYAEGRRPMVHNGAVLSRRLKEMRPKLFCKQGKMLVDILDVASKFLPSFSWSEAKIVPAPF
jgi:hypothetical protein